MHANRLQRIAEVDTQGKLQTKKTVEICERIRLSISAIGCSIKAIQHITAFRAREKNKIWDFEVERLLNLDSRSLVIFWGYRHRYVTVILVLMLLQI